MKFLGSYADIVLANGNKKPHKLYNSWGNAYIDLIYFFSSAKYLWNKGKVSMPL
jgi:hypothetical protein